VLAGVSPGGGDHGVALAPVGFEPLEREQGGVGVGGGVDRAQVFGDRPPVFVGDEAQALAD
jgi:hypothetical protein